MSKKICAITVVAHFNSGDEEAKAAIEKALELLRPYRTAMSTEDEMSILDFIENHEEFPEWIAEEARAICRSLFENG